MKKSFFIARVQELLVEKDWKVSKLAEESDVPPSTIYNMFSRNSEPKLETAFKLIEGFHMSVDEFLYPGKQNHDPSKQQKALIELTDNYDESDWLRIMAYAKALYDTKKE